MGKLYSVPGHNRVLDDDAVEMAIVSGIVAYRHN